MAISKRIVLFTLILFVSLILILVFWPFIVNEFVMPIAKVVWLGLRIFVLSIDQKYYWGAFTLVLMLVLFRHFFQGGPEVEAEKGTYTSVVFTDIEYWQNNFMTYSNSPAEQDFIKRELIQLLTSMYASTQDGTPQFLVLDAIKEKAIPLPEHIYAFFFSEELQDKRPSFKKTLKNILQMPLKWINQKREGKIRAMQTRRMIEEVLIFMESSLGIDYDIK